MSQNNKLVAIMDEKNRLVIHDGVPNEAFMIQANSVADRARWFQKIMEAINRPEDIAPGQ